MTTAQSTEKECRAARTSCILIDHAGSGIIEVRGRDRVEFLHNLLTNDIKNLAAGTGCPAAYLNAQAKVVAYMAVLCFKDKLWVHLEPALRKKVLEILTRLIITEEVALLDRFDDLACFSIHGPKAKAVFRNVVKERSFVECVPFNHAAVNACGTEATCVCLNETGDCGFGFFVPAEQRDVFRSRLLEAGARFTIEPIGANALNILKIEAGIPRYGIDFDETTLLPETGLDRAVNFTKGCFPGQEIIARLDSRGGLSKKLLRLVSNENAALSKGAKILLAEKEIGFVTSSAYDPALKQTVAMGYLKRGHWREGMSVEIAHVGGNIPALIKTLPAADTSGST